MSEKNDDNQPLFSLQRIYLKDLSFESPKSPEIFKEQWTPEVDLDLNTHNESLGADDLYEVWISLTVTVKSKQQIAFVAEVKQAGIFLIRNIPADNMKQTLGAFCPNILFPYAREALDSVIVKGSFPPVMLAPINFDAVYEQAKKQQAQSNNNHSVDDATKQKEKDTKKKPNSHIEL